MPKAWGWLLGVGVAVGEGGGAGQPLRSLYFEPIPFDADAARAFGRVAAALRRAGHKRRARALDAMIAATAVANHLPVYTCDPADFAGVEGLGVIPIRLAEGRCR